MPLDVVPSETAKVSIRLWKGGIEKTRLSSLPFYLPIPGYTPGHIVLETYTDAGIPPEKQTADFCYKSKTSGSSYEAGIYVSFWPACNNRSCNSQREHFHTKLLGDQIAYQRPADIEVTLYLDTAVINRSFIAFQETESFQWSLFGSSFIDVQHVKNCAGIVSYLLELGGITRFISNKSLLASFIPSYLLISGANFLIRNQALKWALRLAAKAAIERPDRNTIGRYLAVKETQGSYLKLAVMILKERLIHLPFLWCAQILRQNYKIHSLTKFDITNLTFFIFRSFIQEQLSQEIIFKRCIKSLTLTLLYLSIGDKVNRGKYIFGILSFLNLDKLTKLSIQPFISKAQQSLGLQLLFSNESVKTLANQGLTSLLLTLFLILDKQSVLPRHLLSSALFFLNFELLSNLSIYPVEWIGENKAGLFIFFSTQKMAMWSDMLINYFFCLLGSLSLPDFSPVSAIVTTPRALCHMAQHAEMTQTSLINAHNHQNDLTNNKNSLFGKLENAIYQKRYSITLVLGASIGLFAACRNPAICSNIAKHCARFLR